MKKQRKNAGFSLIEMLCTLLILVLLVMGIGVGMDAGTKIYSDAIFEANSATLAGILNTSLGDILRYSIDVQEPTTEEKVQKGIPNNVDFLFTNLEYGVQDAYFHTPVHENGTYMGVLQMRNTHNTEVMELVNSGAYPNLAVSEFNISYIVNEEPAEGTVGGFFKITYKIYDENNLQRIRMVDTIVRLMND